MTFHRPGTYVDEVLLQTTAPVNSTVAAAAFVGAAVRGPVTPTLLQSWTDALRALGKFTGVPSEDVLRLAVYNAYQAGARDVYVTRVAGASAAAATLPFIIAASPGPGAPAVDFSAINPGTWGNRLYIEVTAGSDAKRVNLTVREVPVGVVTLTNQQIVDRITDVSLNPSDARYILRVVNGGTSPSSYIRAALHTGYTYTADDVLAVSGTPGGDKLTGGLNGSAVVSSDLVDAVYSLDAITQPFVLNLPGVVDNTTITAVADYVDATRTRQDDSEPGRGDVFVVVDTAAGSDADTAITAVSAYPASDCLAVYYPPVVIADPTNSTPGSTVLVPVGPLVVGRYMATDASRGVFKAPAGTVDGLLSTVVALDPAATLKNPQLDALNDALINAVKPIPNRGVCIFGARTLLSSFITRYVPARRTLISATAELVDATSFAPFENNDSFLWAHLFSVADKVCRELWTAGGLKGGTDSEAYFVKCDSDNNTLDLIDQGVVTLEVGLALQRPAEFVVIKIGQFEGGVTVTESAA